MNLFIINLSYLYGSVSLLVFVMVMFLLFLKNLIFIKFMILLIYIGGVIVFVLYISCLCVDKQLKFNLVFWLIFFIGFWVMEYFMNLEIILNMSLILCVGLIFNLILFLYSMNLFKMSGSLRL